MSLVHYYDYQYTIITLKCLKCGPTNFEWFRHDGREI